MKRLFISASVLSLIIIPQIAFGAANNGFMLLIKGIGGIIGQLIGITATLALVVFFWGLVKYLWGRSGDTNNHEEGINIMKWGIVALFVMTSIWGLVGFLQSSFGLDSSTTTDSTTNGSTNPCLGANPPPPC